MIVKMNILLKANYRLHVISIKILMSFMKMENSTQHSIKKHKRPQISKIILSKISNVGGISIPQLKLYYTAIAKKRMILV
jgi:hypothetical protein